jgi:hypothetical protein
MRSLHGRLEKLERESAGGGVVVLEFADGSKHNIQLPRHGDGVGEIYREAFSNPSGETANLIRRSVASHEPGGSHLIELARSVLVPVLDSVDPEVQQKEGK